MRLMDRDRKHIETLENRIRQLQSKNTSNRTPGSSLDRQQTGVAGFESHDNQALWKQKTEQPQALASMIKEKSIKLVMNEEIKAAIDEASDGDNLDCELLDRRESTVGRDEDTPQDSN